MTWLPKIMLYRTAEPSIVNEEDDFIGRVLVVEWRGFQVALTISRKFA